MNNKVTTNESHVMYIFVLTRTSDDKEHFKYPKVTIHYSMESAQEEMANDLKGVAEHFEQEEWNIPVCNNYSGCAELIAYDGIDLGHSDNSAHYYWTIQQKNILR